MKIGIIGLGFVGKLHLATLRKTRLAEVVAVADQNVANLSRKSTIDGNIPLDQALLDLDGVAKYTDGEALLADDQVEAALITLPTHLHKYFILKALHSGKQVICEKPMVLNTTEGREVLEALDRLGKALFVAHCIRFWPAYAQAREVILEGQYGKVLRAHYMRHSPMPSWGAGQWSLDSGKSGGCILDLHIHDVDYVNFVFGLPAKIHAHGMKLDKKGICDVMAAYVYDDGKIITLEAGWAHPTAYPFRMGFRVVMEHATLEFNTLTDGKLHVYTTDGKTITPPLSEDDGYTCEHRHFIDCITTGKASAIVTPQSSFEALQLVEREMECIG